MIVDGHTHLNYPAGESDIAEHMEACKKVSVSIVFPSVTDDTKKANKQISEYVNQHDNMVGFAIINPVVDKIGMRSMNSVINDMNLKGVVLYCASNQFHPAHSRAMRFYQIAEEMGFPVFFHNSSPLEPDAVLEYTAPFILDEVARKFKNLKIIIGQMGLPFLNQTICLLSKHPNIYADLTICPGKIWEIYKIVISAYEANVMDKLLFGSGYPDSDPGSCIERLLGFNRLLADTNLPAVPREKIRSVIERDTLSILGINR